MQPAQARYLEAWYSGSGGCRYFFLFWLPTGRPLLLLTLVTVDTSWAFLLGGRPLLFFSTGTAGVAESVTEERGLVLIIGTVISALAALRHSTSPAESSRLLVVAMQLEDGLEGRAPWTMGERMGDTGGGGVGTRKSDGLDSRKKLGSSENRSSRSPWQPSILTRIETTTKAASLPFQWSEKRWDIMNITS